MPCSVIYVGLVTRCMQSNHHLTYKDLFTNCTEPGQPRSDASLSMNIVTTTTSTIIKWAATHTPIACPEPTGAKAPWSAVQQPPQLPLINHHHLHRHHPPQGY